MKQINLVFVLAAMMTFSVACSSSPKTVRQTASAKEAVVAKAKQYAEPTMVNVVTINRFLASEDGMREISKSSDPVVVTSQWYKAPGQKIQHGMLQFTIKNRPEIAGQIMGNSGGSPISTKFTQVVARIQKEGANAKAASVLARAQTRFNEIAKVGKEQRTEAIKAVLYETRDQLLASY